MQLEAAAAPGHCLTSTQVTDCVAIKSGWSARSLLRDIATAATGTTGLTPPPSSSLAPLRAAAFFGAAFFTTG